MSTRATFSSEWPMTVLDKTDTFGVGRIVEERGSYGNKKHKMKKTEFVKLFRNTEVGPGGRSATYNARSIWTKVSGNETKGEYVRIGPADTPSHWHLNDLTNNTSFPKKTIAQYETWKTGLKAYLRAGISATPSEQVTSLAQ